MKEFYFKRVLLVAAWALCTLCTHAEEVEATFLVVELSSGQTESIMLTNDPSLPAPMLRHKEGIIVLNGMPYSTNEVKGEGNGERLRPQWPTRGNAEKFRR